MQGPGAGNAMANRSVNRFEGACHCGAIRLALSTGRDAAGLTPRRCDCDFCRKHACVYVAAADGRLEITARTPELVGRYAFGHRSAEFLVCRSCGVMPAALSVIDGQMFGIVNANVFDPPLAIDRAALAVGDYDGETMSGRLDRRKGRWIPEIVLHGLE